MISLTNSGKSRQAKEVRDHGFIDIHTHGIGGYDTRGATPEIILKIAGIHGARGVSVIIPTIYAAPIEAMRADMAAVREAISRQDLQFGVGSSEPSPDFPSRGARVSGCPAQTRSFRSSGSICSRSASELLLTQKAELPCLTTVCLGQPDTVSNDVSGSKNTLRLTPHASRVLGVHLEGPFLNSDRCGALDKSAFLEPTGKNLKKLIGGFEDIVRIITIAPELKGATRLIKTIADMGIIVSMGHSDATYAEAEAGYKAGAKGITHIFNAMRGIHHREPGIAGFGLLNKEVYIEVIADPFHLSLKTIELIFKVKDPKKILIVSDTVKGIKATSARNGVRNKKGMLLGGSMTIPESARRLIDMGLGEKIVMDCVSRNPAAYLNLPGSKSSTES